MECSAQTSQSGIRVASFGLHVSLLLQSTLELGRNPSPWKDEISGPVETRFDHQNLPLGPQNQACCTKVLPPAAEKTPHRREGEQVEISDLSAGGTFAVLLQNQEVENNKKKPGLSHSVSLVEDLWDRTGGEGAVLWRRLGPRNPVLN